jgi:hypothetical protein
MDATHYDLLGLSFDADDGEIERAYRKKKVEYKTDAQRLQQLEVAYAVLANPSKRKAYLIRISSGAEVSRSVSQSPAQEMVRGQPPARSPVPKPEAGGSKGRKGTVLYGEDEEVQAQPPDLPSKTIPTQPAASGGKGRKSTVLYGEDEVDQAPEPVQPVNPTPSGGGRRRETEIGSRSVEEPPAIKAAPRRRETEINDGESAAQDVKPAAQAGAPMAQDVKPAAQAGAPMAQDVKPAEQAGAPMAQVDRTTKHFQEELAMAKARPAEGEQQPSVRVIYGGYVEIYPLKPGNNIIGRPPKSGGLPEIPIPDPYVSRQHAIIHVEGEACSLTDQNSDNGTCLNGMRIEPLQPQRLKDGDSITIEGHLLKVKLT